MKKFLNKQNIEGKQSNIRNMMKEFSLLANEFKTLCYESDRISRLSIDNAKKQEVVGWKVVDNKYNPDTEFKAVAYEKANKIVICYVGTNFKSIQDIITDVAMVFKATRQMREALAFYKKIELEHKSVTKQLIVSGHSEGGSEAQYVSVKKGGVPTFTYNAFMTGHLYSSSERKKAHEYIYNYRHPDDIVSKAGRDIGYQFLTSIDEDAKWYSSLFGIRKNHQISAIGDCLKAVPVEQFKQEEPRYSEKLDEIIILREDIMDMPLEEFRVLKSEILNRHKQGWLLSRGQANYLVKNGLLDFVESYQRADGTIVKEYYRRCPQQCHTKLTW